MSLRLVRATAVLGTDSLSRADLVEQLVRSASSKWGLGRRTDGQGLGPPVAASLAGRPHDREALVFTAPMGGPLSRADFVKFVFRPAVRAANEAMVRLPKDQRPAPLPEGLRFYDLRHTCASLLIAQGASVKAVQAQLGHATASITLDTYGHLFPSEMDTLGDRLELVRDVAVTRLGRTQHGPADDCLGETAGG